MNNSSNLEKDIKSTDRLTAIIFLVLLCLMPLLMHPAIIYTYSPLIRELFFNTGLKRNIFTYYKFRLLVAACVFLTAVFLYRILRQKYEIARRYVNAPLLILVLLTAISALLAPFKNLAMYGQWYRHEGTLTYLSYLIIFFIAAQTRYSLKWLKLFFFALVPLVLINVTLGVIYLLGKDPFTLPVIHSLFLGSFPSPGGLNTTLENQDFMSGIGGVLTALFLTQAVLVPQMKQKALYLLFALLSFTMLLSATATSGFIALLAVVPLIAIFTAGSSLRKQGFLTLLAALVCFCAVFVVLDSYNPTVGQKTIGFFTSAVHPSQPIKPAAERSPNQLPLSDGDAFSRLPKPGLSAGDGRIYIWQKTIQLIKERPLFGHGMDTLGYFFPQDDPAGISLDWGQFQDKAHNLYLSIAFGSGLPALFAFLTLLLSHFWVQIRLFRQGIEGERRIILVSLFCAWCTYLVQALFNNSVISTAPIFWILFGVSVALTYQELGLS